MSETTDPMLKDLTWYTLAVFGPPATTTLKDEPQFRDHVRNLAAQLRVAATKTKLVAGGADNETVYLSVRDWLVGEFQLSAAEADQTPVAQIMAPLSHFRSMPDPATPTGCLGDEELLARAFLILRGSPQIPPTELAIALGVSRGTLYRKSPRWQPILAALKQASTGEVPVGYKSTDGELDAWTPPPPKSTQSD